VSQTAERLGEHGVDDPASRFVHRLPGLGEVVLDAAAMPRSADDEALVDESRGECSERLVTHEGLAGQPVSGRAGMPHDRAQRIPLRKSRADLAELPIGPSVVTVLSHLHGASQLLQRVEPCGRRHAPRLSQLVYINMLI